MSAASIGKSNNQMDQDQGSMADEGEHFAQSIQFSVERSSQCMYERYRGGVVLSPDQLPHTSILCRFCLIVVNSNLRLQFLQVSGAQNRLGL